MPEFSLLYFILGGVLIHSLTYVVTCQSYFTQMLSGLVPNYDPYQVMFASNRIYESAHYTIVLPFTIIYAGRPYKKICVNSNSYLGFTDACSDPYPLQADYPRLFINIGDNLMSNFTVYRSKDSESNRSILIHYEGVRAGIIVPENRIVWELTFFPQSSDFWMGILQNTLASAGASQFYDSSCFKEFNSFQIATYAYKGCPLNCFTCSQLLGCWFCIDGAELVEENGTQICRVANCQVSQCETCLSPTTCRTCVKGYYQDSDLKCSKCGLGCAQCESQQICIACDDSYSLQDGSCFTNLKRNTNFADKMALTITLSVLSLMLFTF